jgi:hypothetical protein
MRNPETTTYKCTMIVLNHVPQKKSLHLSMWFMLYIWLSVSWD